MLNILSTVIIYPLIQIVEISYVFFYRFFKNPGISVIGVSLAVTLLCLPLYIVAERWQQIQRDTEAKLKPRTDRIKAAFKGDEQYMMLSTYYRQNHYHPIMALRSSFGLLIQIPFFIAAYQFLSNMPALKGQPFLFIHDMGAPDRLFRIGSFYVNILPIAMTAINIIAGAIYTKGFAAKEKIQIYAMALVFLVLLYNSPAGLVLYWTMNNIFSLIKNIFYKLKNPKKVLYVILCIFVFVMDVYVIFRFKNAARIIPLKIIAVLLFTSLLFIPFVVKFFNRLVNVTLSPVLADKKLRFGIFIFSAVSCCLLSGLVLPSLLVSSSVQEFADIAGHGSPNYFVWNTFLQSLGFFVFWPVCIYFLFRGRIQTLLTLFLSCLLVCGFCNAFLFPGNYGTMNEWLVFVGWVRFDRTGILILNIAVLLVLIAAVILAMKFIPKFLSSFMLICCIGFLAFGIVNGNSISSKYKYFKTNINSAEIPATLNAEFHLTKTGQNVVVIMLDRAMSAFVEPIFEERPDLYDAFDGFTFYKNCASYNGHTLFGSPPLYGGYEYTPWEREKRNDTTFLEQHNESLLLMPRVFTEQADFVATIADSSWADWSWIPNMKIADKYPLIDGKTVATKYNFEFTKLYPELKSDENLRLNVLKRDFLWVSLFRESPMILRPYVFYDTTWWSSENIKKRASVPEHFSELYFLPELTDFSSEKNSFVYFVNELTHDSTDLQAPDYVPVKQVTKRGTGKFAGENYHDVNASALIHIGKWLKFLQDENCYDNTRIIIVSDHGGGSENNKVECEDFDNPVLDVPRRDVYMKDRHHPLLLVKDFNAHGTLKTDMTFMTNADVPLLAFKDIVQNPVNPFTNNPVTDEIKKRDGAVILTPFIWNSDDISDMYTIPAKPDEWFTVKDNIFESKNWTSGIPDSAK